MGKLIECVPNYSEGRDLAKVEKIVDCFRGKEGVKLLDYSSDESHNRTVVTVIGEPEQLKAAVANAETERKEMAKIDWNNNAQDIVNQIRAFNPSPVAYTTFENNPFKVYTAEVSHLKGEVGKILKADKELVIGCKDCSVSLKVVQKAGGKAMSIADFLRGNKLNVNEDFC